MTETQSYDVLVIGGGINGAGVARDAAGRGLRVALCEQHDLASHTSSKSTKLIHGGLRYLEHYEFRLVREALKEREVLLRAAPHIIWPLRFVLPHNRSLRPTWLIRLGLFLYDHLGGRELLPASHSINLRKHPLGAPLAQTYRRGFVYSDCWVQDSRLVVLSALDAKERGADIMTRAQLTSATQSGGLWEAVLRLEDGTERKLRSRSLVNAAGPWVEEVIDRRVGVSTRKSVRLVAGSHIVVPKLFDHEHAYIFQQPDDRVVFAIPYEGDFTLIGTTENEYHGNPGDVRISSEEINYLCKAVSEYFERKVVPEDVVWTYSGVRPLFDEDEEEHASTVSRDYELEVDHALGSAPLLSIFGGKITTFRKLAEHAVDILCDKLGIEAGAWSEAQPLPGGDMPDADFDGFLRDFKQASPWLPPRLAFRMARNYGTRARQLLGSAGGLDALGEPVAGDLHEAELEYLIQNEWALTADDILWRRTKLGLHLPKDAHQRLAKWMDGSAARVRESA